MGTCVMTGLAIGVYLELRGSYEDNPFINHNHPLRIAAYNAAVLNRHGLRCGFPGLEGPFTLGAIWLFAGYGIFCMPAPIPDSYVTGAVWIVGS